MNPIVRLADLYAEGDDLLMRLRRAETRDDVAHGVWAIRRWRHEVIDAATAYSVTLAESLAYLNPAPHETVRAILPRYIGGGERYRSAHRVWLVVAATILTRLGPALAKAEPARRQGRPKTKGGKLDDSAAITEAKRLMRAGGMKRHTAAKEVVKRNLAASGISKESDAVRIDTKLSALGF